MVYNIIMVLSSDTVQISVYYGIICPLFYLSGRKGPRLFEKRKWISWGMVSSFIISTAGGILLTLFYNPNISWMRKCNTVLENRLALGKNALNTYGYKLLGIRLQYVGNGLDIFGERKTGEYNYVDCLYVSVLQKYGVLFLIVFIVLLTMTMFYLYKEKNYFIMIIMTSIAFRGLIDNTFFPLYFNTFWLLIGIEVFGKRKKKADVCYENTI